MHRGRQSSDRIREDACGEYGINPHQIGIMGFSRRMVRLLHQPHLGYTPANRPDFVAPIYAFMPPSLQGVVPEDAPPLFVVAATDDNLGLAPHSIDLYSKWLAAKKPAEIHIYQQGSHGFGMSKQNIPTDTWIERFGDWLGLLGFLKAK